MPNSQLSLLSEIAQLFSNAASDNRRSLLSIECRPEQCLSYEELHWLVEHHQRFSLSGNKNPVVWIGEDLPEWADYYFETVGVPLQHCHQARAKDLLGTSNQLIVYDARQVFSPNVFAASIDSLLGSGVYLLLQNHDGTGSERLYQAYLLDRFSYFEQCYAGNLKQFELAEFSSAINQAELYPVKPDSSGEQSETPACVQPAPRLVDANKQQQKFVEQSLASLNQQQQSNCLMLEAKRGRGKSAALAWLVEKWLDQNSDNLVWLCAPSRKQVQTQMAIWSTGNAGVLDRIRFHAIDELLDKLNRNKSKVPSDSANTLVVIDEAAAISLALLQKIAAKKFDLVLATTTVGYEGSGRGFLLRFKNYLKKIYSSCAEYELEEPIRWSQADKLEILVEDICGLGWHEDEFKNKAAKEAVAETTLGTLSIDKISRESLISNTSLLRNIYGLLVDAHYQTQPSDLQRLLDDEGIHLWAALTEQNHVVGVLQATQEGGFRSPGREKLAKEIALGSRRPPGNLVAQRLAYHYNEPEWCLSDSLRVMRIAVEGNCQRQGVGSRLIDAMTAWAEARQFDFWSSSFGYSDGLMSFWREQRAEPVYLGSRVDKASGSTNAMVVGAVGDRGFPQVQTQFRKEQVLRQLVFEHSVNKLASAGINGIGPEEQSRLQRFIEGSWDWDSAFALIVLRLIELVELDANFKPKPERLLNDLVHLAPDWKALATQYGLSGKAKYFDFIRTYLAQSHNLEPS